MANNLVIFIPEEIPGLSAQFELGTGEKNFCSVTTSDFNRVDLEELRSRDPKKFTEGEPGFDEAEFGYRKSKKMKQRIHSALVGRKALIIIEEKLLLPSDYREIKSDVAETYSADYISLDIQSSKSTPIEAGCKALYFISGKEFEHFAELLTKGTKEGSKVIPNLKTEDDSISVPADTRPVKEKMDDDFITAIKDPRIQLIAVNTSRFSKEDFDFYTRAGKTGKYISQEINLPPEEKEIENEKTGSSENDAQQSGIEQEESSPKAKSEKKTHWWDFIFDDDNNGKNKIVSSSSKSPGSERMNFADVHPNAKGKRNLWK
ncbi:MAG TPA: hypothetical protein VG621_00225 [Candidatus Paceibacterota bacterium]|nr:hypothetical protein [Candidatus Paceibacterota bacterium]